MNTKKPNPVFSLKNFRSFGEEGADFELAPITVLTGCNSAGKSSLVKAQLLLEQVLKEMMAAKTVHLIDLHVSNKEFALGNYSKILNKNANTGKITFSFIAHSNMLSEDVEVEFVFVGKKNDIIDDGILSSLSIKKSDGTIISSVGNLQEPEKENIFNEIIGKPKQDESINYLCILENFRRFIVFGRYEWMTNKKYWDEEFGDSKETTALINKRFDEALDACKKAKITKEDAFAYRSTEYLDITPDYDKYDEVSSWLELGTFFHQLPIFKDVEGKEKKFVREYLLKKAHQQNNDWKKAEDWVNHFCDDFENSSYDSFLNYFVSLEKMALEKGLFRFKDYHSPVGPLDVTETLRTLFFEDEGEEKSKDDDLMGKSKESNRISRKDYDNWSFQDNVDALIQIVDPTPYIEFWKASPKKENVILKAFQSYIQAIYREMLNPEFLQNVKYVNSSSVAIKRLYSTEDTDKIGLCIKKYHEGNKQKFEYTTENDDIRKAKTEYIPGSFMNKWVREFGIGDEIRIEGTEEGLGVLMYLIKEGEKRILADEGYGITQLVALLLQIENNILNATLRSVSIAGVNQYPLQYVPSTIYVEEPEVHLHPKYQSLLADMFVEAYKEYNIHFTVETHSEYLIRKLQVMVADKNHPLSSEEVSLNYIEKDVKGISHNKIIKIEENGRLSNTFGPGFFDEADSLAMELLRYKSRKQ